MAAPGLVRVVGAEHAAGYPTTGSTVVDTTGGEQLVVLLYSNATWAGPDPTVTYAGAPLAQHARYDSTAAGYQSVFVLSAAVGGNATGALAYSQSAQTYNSERHVHAFVLSGADLAALTTLGVTRAADAPSFVTTFPALSGESRILAAGYAYYLNSPPSVSSSSVPTTAGVTLNAGSAARSRSVHGVASAAGSITWSCDSWNYAAGMCVAVPGSGGAPPPMTVAWKRWNGTGLDDVSVQVWDGAALVPVGSYERV